MVVIRFDNGAIATCEANFSASYGYDVRGEVFGSQGMVSAGDTRQSSMTLHTADGRVTPTVRGDVELFADAYTAEFVEFTDAVREGREPAVTGRDARRALAVALACIESVQASGPVEGRATHERVPAWLPRRRCCSSTCRSSSGSSGSTSLGFLVEIWDWTTKDIDALVATGAEFSSMTGYIEGDLTTDDGSPGCWRPPSSRFRSRIGSRARGSTCTAPASTATDCQSARSRS